MQTRRTASGDFVDVRTVLVLITACFLLNHPPPATGQTFSYPNFGSTAGLVLNGSAAPSGVLLRMTPALPSLAGSCWTASPALVAGGFDTTFVFRIGPGSTPGADGFAFVVQNDFAGSSALGDAGGEMGYTNVVAGTPPLFGNSLGFEFDTYANLGETSPNEISVHANGTGPNQWQESYSIGRASPPFSLADGLPHTVRVLYVPGTLRLFIDNPATPLLTIAYDIVSGGFFADNGAPVSGLALSQNAAFVGFTAGTGGLFASHEILSWTWTSAPLPDPCFAGTIGQGPGGPFDVLRLNLSSGGVLRRVNVPMNAPLVISVDSPPLGALQAPFILWGTLGVPNTGNALPTPYGTLCFLPELLFPASPLCFTLTDNFGLGLTTLIPSSPAPWSYAQLAGIPVPIVVTLQGLMYTGVAGANYAVTNAVTLDVHP